MRALASTYTANWSFNGFAAFLSYVNIKVYKDGLVKGEADFSNRGNFVNGENKITELVNQLLPW